MGYDAACTIRIEGKTARGTAWLEQRDLVFRGPFRIAVPLAQITEARAEDGTLFVRKGQTTVSERDSMTAGKRAAEKYVIPVAKRRGNRTRG